jgi:predicted Zn finger-like uncharacterized protein
MSIIITCPECNTNYSLKDGSISAKGRTVKCAKCGHSWHQAQPEATAGANAAPPKENAPSPAEERPAAAAAEKPTPEQPAPEKPAPSPGLIAKPAYNRVIPAPPPVLRAPLWLKLLPLGLCAAIIAISFIYYKDRLLSYIPALAKAYEAAGMVDTDQIRITEASLKKVKDGDFTDIYIKASVVNEAHRDQYLPNLRISLLDKDRNPIAANTIDNIKMLLKPGEPFILKNKIPHVVPETAFVVIEVGNKWELTVR